MDSLLESQLAEGISWGFTALISGLAFVLWQKFKRLQDDVEKNKEEIANFKTHVAENYSQKKDIYDMEARINEQLSHLGHRLDKGFNMIYEQLLRINEMPSFSQTSQQRLNTCHEKLQRIFNEVIKNYDCTILVGYRTPAEQEKCYKTGKSKLKYGHHNNFPATAVDVSPWPIPREWGAKDWKERAKFYYFAGFVKATAQSMNIKLRWGGDWNDNKDFSDQTFDDLVHFELV